MNENNEHIPEEGLRALGVALASDCHYFGADILAAAAEALEFSNFFDEAARLREMFS